MGVLSNATSELCGEIVAMRQQRRALANRLEQENKARTAAARKMCNDLTSAHVRMTTELRRRRQSFLRKLEQFTRELRRDVRADIAGARRAWAGKVT